MLRAAQELKREIGYNPTRWLGMVAEYGAVEAAKRLVSRPGGRRDSRRLGARAADASFEALMLQPRYAPLFSDAERETARRWLEEVGFDVGAYLRKVGWEDGS